MKLLHSILLICSGVFVFAQNDSLLIDTVRYELPLFNSTETVIDHYGYSLIYSEQHEQAKWVAYQLKSSELDGPNKRTDQFIEDPMIETGSATIDDYYKSGYDRGHLAPAADMSWSDTAMYESFYFSNMSPQSAGFNRGIWKRLEAKVRDWASQYKYVYVVTGPILTDSLPSIGKNEVAIPNAFYKALLIPTDSAFQSIAFILPHESSSQKLETYSYTIDSLEQLSGIDFYPLLADSIEETVESKIDISFWFDSPTLKENPDKNPIKKGSQPCKGITQNGKRCKRKTKNKNGYCFQHQK